MHWIGPTLLVLSLILLPLALRGRLTARGLFCRRCKFDLQGLNPARPNPTCPECGRDLTHPKSTKPTLRRTHRPALAAALILLLAGAALTTLSRTTRGPAFYARLPDTQIIWLNRLGVDEALTELSARAGRIPPMSDAHWHAVIPRALAHQADTNTPWDPRWGDVLAQALLHNRLTEDQIREYLEHAYEPRFDIRDRIVHDESRIGYWVTWNPGRIGTTTRAINTGMKSFQHLTRDGLVGDATPERLGSGRRGDFVIPSHGTPASGSSGSSITIPDEAQHTQPLRVYVETRVTFTNTDGDTILKTDPKRHEQAVRILPPGEAIVRRITDPLAGETIRAHANLSPLIVTLPRTDQPFRHGSTAAGQVQINFSGDRPRAMAGRLYAVLDSGELELAAISLPAGSGNHGVGLNIDLTASDAQHRLPMLRDLAARSTVDVIFRTDPAAANTDPRIDEVVELTMLFPAVPVLADPTPEQRWDSVDHNGNTPAAPNPDPGDAPAPNP